jgi:hypothetical protein
MIMRVIEEVPMIYSVYHDIRERFGYLSTIGCWVWWVVVVERGERREAIGD